MKKLDAQTWRDMLISGVNNLANNVDRINALNVFPVPDGDTGSNMYATAKKAIDEIASLDMNNIGELASKFSRGMLLGARGNSGVILSQIFKGISLTFENKETVEAFDLVNAFSKASETAYKSVMKPVEGTILTVIRVTSEKLNERITKSTSLEKFFTIALEEAKVALSNTPELLPVLKEVGVVDSGGEGLVMLLEGIERATKGEPIKAAKEQEKVTKHAFDNISDSEHTTEFGYCTEYIIELNSTSTFDKDKYEAKLTSLKGRSLVVVQDGDILKTHVHIDAPGTALNLGQTYGELLTIKIDNMTLQANASKKIANNNTKKNENKTVAVISCNLGQGIIDDMKSLGTDFIIEGGQTMNPAAQDFFEAIERIPENDIIILPNNSNILLVAQQVVQTSKRNIVIIPTKTQMQGVVAMMYFNPEGTLAENEKEISDAISTVRSIEITKSIKDTSINGVKIKKNEYLSILDSKIIGSYKVAIDAALKAVNEGMDDDTEIVTIFYGQEVSESDAEDLASEIENKHDVEVEVKNGQQPIYDFLISIE